MHWFRLSVGGARFGVLSVFLLAVWRFKLGLHGDTIWAEEGRTVVYNVAHSFLLVLIPPPTAT